MTVNLSISVTFDLSTDPMSLVIRDTSDYDGQSVDTSMVKGVIKLKSPLGIVTYNNADFDNPDIIFPSGQRTGIPIPLDETERPFRGNYVITYTVDIDGRRHELETTINFTHICPDVDLDLTINGYASTVLSEDKTDYESVSIINSFNRTHTVTPPPTSSLSEVSNDQESISFDPNIWSGEWVSTLRSVVDYQYTDHNVIAVITARTTGIAYNCDIEQIRQCVDRFFIEYKKQLRINPVRAMELEQDMIELNSALDQYDLAITATNSLDAYINCVRAILVLNPECVELDQVVEIEPFEFPEQLGQSNDGENVGDGANVFKEKFDAILRFRSLRAGDNVTITEEENEIIIAASSTGAENLGEDEDGLPIYVADPENPGTLKFKRIKQGTGITIVETDNSLELQADRPVTGEEITVTEEGYRSYPVGTVIPAGTETDDIISNILAPYVPPSGLGLSISLTPQQSIYEVGRIVTINSATVSIQNQDSAGNNPSNIQITGPGFNKAGIIGSTNADPSSTFTQNTNTGQSWGATADDANDDAIPPASFGVNFRFRYYLGASSTVLSSTSTNNEVSTVILALQTTSLLNSRIATLNTPSQSDLDTHRTVVAYPAKFGDLTGITQDGALPVLGPAFDRLGVFDHTNQHGVTEPYVVYQSKIPKAFPANTQLAMR